MKRFILVLIPVFIFFASCVTPPKGKDAEKASLEQIKKDNEKFLKGDDKKGSEIFRVLISSDEYTVSHLKFKDTISRTDDIGGDRYMTEEIKKLDKIEEVRTAEVSIWLFPDSGRVMKVRPKTPAYLVEIDKLINDDIQRWNFKFPKKVVEPTKFDVKYRIILRKKQSDEDIIKEVQQKLKESR